MRAFNDLVILRPREDLERQWNSSLIHTPDNALLSADQMVGFRHDHTAIAEVYRVPEGLRELQPGDGALLPLFSASKVVIIDGAPYLACKRQAIAARVTGLGTPEEAIEPLNGFVLTKRDREAFEKRLNGGLGLTDDAIDDGIQCDGGSEGIVRAVLERCVSVGWTRLSPELQSPGQKAGELLFFNPLASCRFRRFGVNYRLTPSEDIQFGLED